MSFLPIHHIAAVLEVVERNYKCSIAIPETETTLVYRYTKEQRFLNFAQKATDLYLNRRRASKKWMPFYLDCLTAA